ncbi:MAG: hypothetical protein HXY34_03195 [Candidatus Thorarchaeota archaeon]|nr:hypothetical protein [Candidatus Thorarchaeota archaeon]
MIDRTRGMALVARTYEKIEIDMDLIAPFLSATHTFIDKASNESLRTIDTQTSRYVWDETEQLLFVMVVSKQARTGHIRFLLKYAMDEFQKNFIPEGQTVDHVLRVWHGDQNSFTEFGRFLDELVSQYEVAGDALVIGKSMDCLEVYNHLFRAIMKVKTDNKTRQELVRRIEDSLRPLAETYPFVGGVPIDEAGVEVLSIDPEAQRVPYHALRAALEHILLLVADTTRKTVGRDAFRDMVFDSVMPYVKRDMQRLQTYAILDDVIRYLF